MEPWIQSWKWFFEFLQPLVSIIFIKNLKLVQF
jgi:hypothetical protein